MRTLPSLHLRICFAISILSLVTVPSFNRLTFSAEEPTKGEKALDGNWHGVLKVGPAEVRLIFRVTKDKDGNLKATLDSPDQGAKGIPLDSVTREGRDVKFESKAAKAVYEGQLSEDGLSIAGKWKQAGVSFALDLKRLDKEPEVARPQVPKRPYPYREEEVTYENAAAKIKLAGTLTLPKSEGPFAAVLLITGSGAQDRDESLLGHKPFLVLADHLTRQGLAVLRVDDRGVGGSSGSTPNSTTDDFAGDVLAGIAYLKGRKEIDPKRIGLAGHSEGGIIAPLVASRSADVAFIVLLAATGVTGEEIIYRQGALIAKVQGATDAAVAASRTGQETLFKIVREEKDPEKAAELLKKYFAERVALAVAASPDAKDAIEAQAKAQLTPLLTPWFRHFLVYDPAPALRKVRCPVLAVNGEKDLQVEPAQNLPPIKKALEESGNADVTIKELPGLNHLFQHAKTGAPSEYGKIEETFAPEALAIISDWILARTAAKK